MIEIDMEKPVQFFVLGEGITCTGTSTILSKFGILSFQACKKSKLGVKPKKVFGPETRIIFSTTDAIDTLVERLLELREKVESNAADDIAYGCLDKPRKISRKGKKR